MTNQYATPGRTERFVLILCLVSVAAGLLATTHFIWSSAPSIAVAPTQYQQGLIGLGENAD